MAVKKRFPYRAALVACKGGCRTAKDGQGCADGCIGCGACIQECKFGAIALYLGADIGGMGSKMTVNAEDGKLYWNIEKRDGTTEQVVINQKESNKY